MPTINSAQKGYGVSTGTVYSTGRSANATFAFNNQTGNASFATGYRAVTARGGGVQHYFYRAFFRFDTSGISSAPSDATITINGHSGFGNTGNLRLVKGTFANNSTCATSDFGSYITENTAYSNEITSWSTNDNDITLNSSALSDMASLDHFILFLIHETHDFDNTAGSSGYNGVYGISFGSTVSIDYTEAASGPTNLTSLNGIAKANITSANTITLANITSINTIS